jgi:hypothetical protein
MAYDFDRIFENFLPVPDGLPLLADRWQSRRQEGLNVMEAAAWLACEPRSSRPSAVHPVVAEIALAVGDLVDDDERQALWPLVIASLGTARPARLLLGWRLRRLAARVLVVDPGPATWQRVLDAHAMLTSGRHSRPRRTFSEKPRRFRPDHGRAQWPPLPSRQK